MDTLIIDSDSESQRHAQSKKRLTPDDELAVLEKRNKKPRLLTTQHTGYVGVFTRNEMAALFSS